MANRIKGWTKDKKDRIKNNADSPTLDEVVMFGCNVHLEQMSDSQFVLIAENKKRRWLISIKSRSGKAKVDAVLYESTLTQESV